MDKTGSSKFAHDLMERIHALQQRLETLSNNERSQFIEEMKESFRATIETVENKLMQHAQFEKAYTYSIYAAIIFLILFVFGGFSNCASTVYSCSPRLPIIQRNNLLLQHCFTNSTVCKTYHRDRLIGWRTDGRTGRHIQPLSNLELLLVWLVSHLFFYFLYFQLSSAISCTNLWCPKNWKSKKSSNKSNLRRAKRSTKNYFTFFSGHNGRFHAQEESKRLSIF